LQKLGIAQAFGFEDHDEIYSFADPSAPIKMVDATVAPPAVTEYPEYPISEFSTPPAFNVAVDRNIKSTHETVPNATGSRDALRLRRAKEIFAKSNMLFVKTQRDPLHILDHGSMALRRWSRKASATRPGLAKRRDAVNASCRALRHVGHTARAQKMNFYASGPETPAWPRRAYNAVGHRALGVGCAIPEVGGLLQGTSRALLAAQIAPAH